MLVYGMALVRVSGRRVLGEFSTLDVIVAMILGSVLSRVVTASAPILGTLAATTLMVAVLWTMGRASARWPLVAHFFEGKPITLVVDGQLLDRERQRQGVFMVDLQAALRKESVESVSGARRVTLEPNGEITIVKPD